VGGPALTDLLAGQVQVFFPPIVVPIGQVRAGKLRALAVTTATRSEALLDLPTVGEFVPGYEASVWFGLGVPKSTPAEIIDKLNREINAALADPRPKRGLPSQPAIRSQARLPTSASSLPMKPRSGPR
jgi:tripartite-type tricarboxylate transporter receptor subunit TctC